jgi:hypothetical protein
VADRLADGVISITGNGGIDMARGMGAFAAVKESGEVATWGVADCGGDSSAVADHLAGGVVSITGNPHAFAAVKESGEVATWGNAAFGGDSSSVADRLGRVVISILSGDNAVAAVKEGGEVFTWGYAAFGGDSNVVADHLAGGVTSVMGNGYAFAAVKHSCEVVTLLAAAKRHAGFRRRGGASGGSSLRNEFSFLGFAHRGLTDAPAKRGRCGKAPSGDDVSSTSRTNYQRAEWDGPIFW